MKSAETEDSMLQSLQRSDRSRLRRVSYLLPTCRRTLEITGNIRDERRLDACSLAPAKMIIAEKSLSENNVSEPTASSKTGVPSMFDNYQGASP